MMPISWILPRARAMFPDRPAIVDGDVRHTFEQLGRRVDALVGGLKIKGVTQGDRVAILDVNSSTYAEAYYACAQAGVVLVPLNSRLAAPELRYILNDAGAKVLLVSDAFFPILEGLRDSLPTVEHVLAYGKGPLPGKALDYEAILKSAQPESACATVDLGDVAQIYYTSGTTGEPKGVCLTYRNMIASAFDSLIGLGLNDKDIWLHGAPMFHLVDAWSIWAMPLIGAPQVTLHYTPEGFMRTVQATRATATGLPPTLISMMANHPKIGQYDLGSLRMIMYGGSPTPLGILQRAVQAIDTSYIHGYGITETSGITTLAHPDDFCVEGPPEKVAMTASAGRAVPLIQLAISDDNGNRLGPNQVGEVVVGGPRVMDCYWNKPKSDERRSTRRVVSFRRCRIPGRAATSVRRRPQEGHDHHRRRERIFGRNREPAVDACGCARGRSDRCPRRAVERSRQGGRRAARRGKHVRS